MATTAPERRHPDPAYLASLRAYLEGYAARTPVRRVAVVGNAPLGPSEERAALIDSADLVFRCNSLVLDEPGRPPTLGRATHVVTLARATRPTPWVFQDYRSRAYLVVDVGATRRPNPPGNPPNWPTDLGAWPISNRELGIPLKIAMRPQRIGYGAVPTTGTLMAYVAHELFGGPELHLTGFSFLSDRGQTEWQHHWGSTVPVHPAHKLDAEGAILQSWVDGGTATFVP
ncbi:hypothetical protein [Nocardioides caldifontis]|uniref:hypothetical protein n=1 Tax=Nocardioides caldifontis TaxID=2588938 RepID=UPI001396AFBA|nr:hypothetical protein [Nocardioides caldifontis]